MEGKGSGSGFHGFQRPLPTPSSGKKAAAENGSSSNNGNQEVCTVREQDRYMPIANVIRIMRRILPSHAKISDDAKETIQECVSEYISFITSEANERCQREQRKTITAEDVLWAMQKLGFDQYISPLTLFLQRYREVEGDRSSSNLVKRTVDMGSFGVGVGVGGAASAATTFGPPSFHIAPHQGILAPPISAGYFKDLMTASAANMSQGQGQGQSQGQAQAQVPVNCYDPYAAYR